MSTSLPKAPFKLSKQLKFVSSDFKGKLSTSKLDKLLFDNFPCSFNDIREFASSKYTSADWLMAKAKSLGLVVRLSSRNNKTSGKGRDRVGFGVKKKVQKIIASSLTEKFVACLFRWGLRKGAMMYPSDTNVSNIAIYMKYKTLYHEVVKQPSALHDQENSRGSCKKWSKECVDALVQARGQTNPPCFRHIASELNRLSRRLCDEFDREYTERDFLNK